MTLDEGRLKDAERLIRFAMVARQASANSSATAQRHEGISPEDFVAEPHRNRYSSLLGRTAHLAYHYGQAILANRSPRPDTRSNERLAG